MAVERPLHVSRCLRPFAEIHLTAARRERRADARSVRSTKIIATSNGRPLNRLTLASFQSVNKLLTNWKLMAHGPHEAARSNTSTSRRVGAPQSAKDTPSSDTIGET
jgi:hypothetical protein